MKEQFVTYEIALKLREIGFNEPCFGFFVDTEKIVPASYTKEGTEYPKNSELILDWVSSPTWQDVIDWIRDEHNIHIEFGMHEFNKWCFGIQYIDSPMDDYPRIAKSLIWDIEDYSSPIEVREKGILKCLEIIKNK